MKILLIEDSPADAFLIVKTLRRYSREYNVDVAPSLARAQGMFAEADYDVALVDLGLPGGDGLQMLSRALEVALGIPIIILIGSDDRERALSSEDSEVGRFLSKATLDPDRLRASFGWAIARRASLQEGQQENAETAQEAKFAALGKMTANIAHEIKNPLQCVASNIDFVRDSVHAIARSRLEESDDAIETHPLLDDGVDVLLARVLNALTDCVGGVDWVRKTIDTMHRLAHPLADERSDADLNELVDTALSLTQSSWKPVASIHHNRGAGRTHVRAIEVQIILALSNLIENAVDAIQDKASSSSDYRSPSIEVTVSTEGEHAVVSVQDNGAGMSDTVLERAFERYFTTKSQGTGSGQGLATVWDTVVGEHGGTVDCESEVGSGTCITLRIPAPDGRRDA